MRDERLYFLFSDVTRVKGVGSAVAKNLQRLLPAAQTGGRPIIRDLLFHLPTGIIDRRFTCPLPEAPDGKVATFVVTVDEHAPPPVKRGKGRPYRVLCSNETGEITLVFFHARSEYIKQVLPEGSQRVVSGRVEHYNYVAQMPHPDVIAPVSQLAEVQTVEPVYPLTVGLTSKRITNLVQDALVRLPELPEWITEDSNQWTVDSEKKPSTVRRPLSTIPWKQALQQAHHPESEQDLLITHPARQRLAYDELLANQLHLALLRQNAKRQQGRALEANAKLMTSFTEALPFTLTAGQQEVIAEIARDMASGTRMTRLLQGDVGSGKTVVALAAMLQAVQAGTQAALMVPTEIVAQQHYEVITELMRNMNKPSPLEGEGGAQSAPGEGYDTKTLINAKKLRHNLTDAEKKLWNVLRNRQFESYKFRRQQPIGPYIADFFCAEYGLVIELDGGQHGESITYDQKRTKFLASQGYHVLRFWNHDVLQNIDGVATTILESLKNTPHPNPSPSRGEGLSAPFQDKQQEARSVDRVSPERASCDLQEQIAEAKKQAPPPAPLPQGEGGVQVELLTGSVKGKARLEVLDAIKTGQAGIIIGTHALFQEKVQFHDLALVIIDEQHRFGVNQRMALSGKGQHPHLLHMTATPIPRSLTMTLYGDMDVSRLTEKPVGRQPITTRALPVSRYNEVMERLKAALERGEKAYWICPMIDEKITEGELTLTPEEDIAAAQLRFTEFTERFGQQVGLVHGRMKADERQAAMQAFADGATRLLVATTVVEVGMDVRDATIIVVEKSQRFGLSQLHQLRGRVGRGDKPSACLLLYSEPVSETGLKRLLVLRDSEDGFHIAEMDLALRGGGDLLGVRQSGLPKYVFADLFEHQDLLKAANRQALEQVRRDAELKDNTPLQLLLQLFGYESSDGFEQPATVAGSNTTKAV